MFSTGLKIGQFLSNDVRVYLWYNIARNWMSRRIAKDSRNIKLSGSTYWQQMGNYGVNLNQHWPIRNKCKIGLPVLPWGILLIRCHLGNILESWYWLYHFQWPAERRLLPPIARWAWNKGILPAREKTNKHPFKSVSINQATHRLLLAHCYCSTLVFTALPESKIMKVC